MESTRFDTAKEGGKEKKERAVSREHAKRDTAKMSLGGGLAKVI